MKTSIGAAGGSPPSIALQSTWQAGRVARTFTVAYRHGFTFGADSSCSEEESAATLSRSAAGDFPKHKAL